MSELPPELIEALRRSDSDAPKVPSVSGSGRVQRGDLRFAQGLRPGDLLPRLVLVLAVDRTTDFAEVLLTHAYDDMACEIDAVVARHVSSAPYLVVVETDLRGVIWTFQLGALVGRLDDDALREIRRVTTEHDVEPDRIRCGQRLAGIVDPRWDFKREEGDEFRALTADCNEASLDEGAWVVEPDVFRPELLDQAEDANALIADMMHWARTRSLELEPEAVEALLDDGALDAERWAAVSELGLDVWTVVQDLVEHSVTAPKTDTSGGPARLVTATHVTARARIKQSDVVHYLGQKETVPS